MTDIGIEFTVTFNQVMYTLGVGIQRRGQLPDFIIREPPGEPG